jgi:predicted DNA-binding protein (UPF0251 family)
MPRPKKWRKVCCLPLVNRFGPLNGDKPISRIIMTVEEYECIRLIDLEGLKQEECAEHMKIARTTVQGIYDDARKKIADSLVNGKILLIEGGDYQLCDRDNCYYGGNGCRYRNMGNNINNGDNK